jgi:hypothetical protein
MVILVQVIHGAHLAKTPSQLRMEIMYYGDSPQQWVEDGTEIMLHEGARAGFGWVNEQKDSVVGRELDQAVIQERSTSGCKHFRELIRVRWRDISFNNGDVDASWWHNRPGRWRQKFRIELVVGNRNCTVEDLACEVRVASDRWTGC